MKELKGKVAIVTGGSRGIGRAIVLKLAGLGCHVAFNYLKSKKEAKELAEEIQKQGVRCKTDNVDIKDFDSVKAWISQIKEELGGIDILINNAGIVIDKSVMMMSPEDWESVIDTNLNGMFNATKACMVTLLKQKSGQIINISSVSGIIGMSGQSNYSSSKGGMNAFTKSVAKEVAGYGIRVNAICPGYIDTDILSKFNEEQRSQIADSVPMKRIGDAEDVADCTAFLLSDDAKYITGQLIQVDGGLVMR